MKKIKNMYLDLKKAGEDYSTGLYIETEDGKIYQQQSTDVLTPFEEITNEEIKQELKKKNEK